MLTLLKSLLNHQVEKLGEFDVDRLYKKEGLLVNDQVITKVLPEETTSDAAELVCQGRTTNLYVVDKRHDLDRIMDHFNVTTIWVNVIKNKQLNTLMDLHAHYPVTQTDSQHILQTEIKIETMTTNDDRIVLTRTPDNVYQYKHQKGTIPAHGLCVETINFPFQEDDLEELKAIKTYFVDQAKGLFKQLDKDLRIAQGTVQQLEVLIPNQTLKRRKT